MEKYHMKKVSFHPLSLFFFFIQWDCVRKIEDIREETKVNILLTPINHFFLSLYYISILSLFNSQISSIININFFSLLFRNIP